MAIRTEEYCVLGFAIEAIVSELLSRHERLVPPRVYLLEGRPVLGAAVEDLVYWWHQSVSKFSHLDNDARIDLLKVTGESDGFERKRFRDLGLEIASMDHQRIPKNDKWEFVLSRAGVNHTLRQGVAHVSARPACSPEYAAAFIMVVGWDEKDGTMHLLEKVATSG